MREAEDLLFEISRTLARTGRTLAKLRDMLAPWFPVSPETGQALEDTTLIATHALLKRFEQHVDAVRAMARTIIRLQGEQDRYRTVRQAFDRLASLGLVDDVGRLMELVDLRDRTAHAYALQSERQARILNAVFDAVPELMTLAARLGRFARETRLLPEERDAVLEELEALARSA
ncbi:MAG: hypothetical protein N2038_06675 [Geminicoccaceae bacterium]|nr:hypothetical protein [Geminicoccaceae bacterium]MCX7629918.1 hypothetical protein [Geminicoccaceae bacterium]